MRTEEVVLEDGSKTLYTYDDAGLHVRTTDYDAHGNIVCDILYDFDALQRVVGWRIFDVNGNLIKRFETDFDSQGLETEKRQYGSAELERMQRYVYDANQRPIEEQHFDASKTLRSGKVFSSTRMQQCRNIMTFREIQSTGLLPSAAVPALVVFALLFLTARTHNQTIPLTPAFDVVNYTLLLEPDIEKKSLVGKETIQLVARTAKLTDIEINCGELTIDSVKEKGVTQKFVRADRRLIITLSNPVKINETREIDIEYHGNPRRGIRFFPDRQQVYTIFSTSQWMVAVDAPDDRATFDFTLILPPNLTGVANGRMVRQEKLPNNKIAYEWRQDSPIPTYVFGFSVGKFRTVTQRHGHVELRYLSEQYTDDELRRIFRDTGDMIDFYENRAGVRYADRVYTQVLAAGGVEQEMSSFTALRETYGKDVLANERAIWLAAHELAHQWWGNMVTNRDWTHFWLNEGLASFMASAYKERRFGRAEYLKNIEEYRANYEKVRAKGKDRSLAFPDWNSPTADDRTLVYDKGAYVIHLLREEMGDAAFWNGIRQYTKKYFGKSVVTADFQSEMQRASKKSLHSFFDKWVYLTS